jgi:hypothetical protein
MNYMCYLNMIDELDDEKKTMDEIAGVGAGIGGGFVTTTELHVMKYDAAMESPDAAQWKKAVEDEHDRMVNNNVWIPVPKSNVPQEAKVLTSTWAMKKKANGTFRARLNCRGFEQVLSSLFGALQATVNKKRRPWRTKGTTANQHKIKKATRPGERISVDQLISCVPGLVGQTTGRLTTSRYKVATVFVDHYSDLDYVHIQESTSADDTIEAKRTFEILS